MSDLREEAKKTIKHCIQLIKKDWSNRGKEYYTEYVYRDGISHQYLFPGIPENIWKEELEQQIRIEFPPAQMRLGL